MTLSHFFFFLFLNTHPTTHFPRAFCFTWDEHTLGLCCDAQTIYSGCCGMRWKIFAYFFFVAVVCEIKWEKKSLFTNKFEWRGVEKFILTFLAIYSSSQAWKQSKETSSIEMRRSSGLRVIFNSRALDEILVELQNFQVQHQRTNNKRQESLKAFHNTQQKKKCFLII